MTEHVDFWRDRLELPAYRVGEAASYTHISPTTVAAWTKTYADRARTVVNARQRRKGLSYLQLIEVAVVAAMRKQGVKLDEIRRARAFFERETGLRYPFAQLKFKTDGVDILLELEGAGRRIIRDKLMAANHNGQFLWADLIATRFEEFNYDQSGGVRSWKVNGNKSAIEIDPKIAFGAPQIAGAPTWAIKDRWAAGEGLADIADDFNVSKKLVAEALAFEGLIVDFERPNVWVN